MPASLFVETKLPRRGRFAPVVSFSIHAAVEIDAIIEVPFRLALPELRYK